MKIKGYRTVLTNTVLSIPLVLDTVGAIANIPEIRGIIPPHLVAHYALGLAILNIVLRKFTTTPIGKSR